MNLLCSIRFKSDFASTSPPKMKPRDMKNQAPAAARAWFLLFEGFRSGTPFIIDFDVILASFWRDFRGLARVWAALGRSWAALGPFGERPESSSSVLEASWNVLEASRGVLRADPRPLERSWGPRALLASIYIYIYI